MTRTLQGRQKDVTRTLQERYRRYKDVTRTHWPNVIKYSLNTTETTKYMSINSRNIIFSKSTNPTTRTSQIFFWELIALTHSKCSDSYLWLIAVTHRSVGTSFTKLLYIELATWDQNSKLRPEASLPKGFRRGGGARSGLPPSWEAAEGRLLYGGWLWKFRPEFGVWLPSI